MADSRRRRKVHHSGDSDDLSDSYDELNTTKETQSSEAVEDCHDSEYDTAGSESETETESQEAVLRESGDGQEEEKTPKKLDDDEDRRNPQYIPKRGTFYEHDDRTGEEAIESTNEPQVERESKDKKVWKDKEDKWNHDRYNDAEQAPKSHEELIAVYGYDIRNEEGPPRARRRRRYGRGPNKYTRNWEDEDAYGKIAATTPNKNVPRKLNKSGEEFPALGAGNKNSLKKEEPVISSAWYSNKAKTLGKPNFPPLQAQNSPKSEQSSPPTSQLREMKISNETNQTWKKDTKNSSYISSSNGNTGGGDADKLSTIKVSPRDSNKKNVQESVSLAASRVRGRGFKANTNNNVSNRVMDSKPKGRGPGPIIPDNMRINALQLDEEPHLVNDVKHMNIVESTSYHPSGRQNKHFNVQGTGQQRTNTVPPRLQQSHPQQQQPQPPIPQSKSSPSQDVSGNRPKRYSSLRQRSTIPEGPSQPNFQPPHSQHTFYPPQAGSSRAVLESQGFAQGHFEQATSVAPPNAPMAGQPVISLPPAPQAPSYAPPPPFLVPTPQFMPPQTAPPNILNYVPAPNGPPFQPNYQGYQGYNAATVQAQGPPQPQELFQPQGCTYYSPAQQQQQQQPVRRPKAAIPILPPPDNNQQQYQSPRNRTKIIPQQQQHHHQQLEVHQQIIQQHQQEHLPQLQPEHLHQLQQEHLQQHLPEHIQHQQELLQQQQQQHQPEHIQQQLELQHFQLQQVIEHAENEKQHQPLIELEQENHQYHLQNLQKFEEDTLQQNLKISQEQSVLEQFEDAVEESMQDPQEEHQILTSCDLQKIDINNQVIKVETSTCLNLEKHEPTQIEAHQDINIETEKIAVVSEATNLVENFDKNSPTLPIIDTLNEAPVKISTPSVTDIIISSSEETVVKNGEAETTTVIENPIIEETAA